jgi:ATP-binding cassette subfamily B protein
MESFKLEEYYGLISPVFQDVTTAFFSIAETVSGAGLEDTDLQRVKSCVQRADLLEKVNSLPNGLYTKLDKQLNDDGTELSGGEAQKLMLARALYKDAPMLVLDEPTAALDPIAESRIYETYHRMCREKTSLFISHRLASTSFCDRVILLEDGKVVEEGSHEELLAFGGRYRRMFDIQSCWYREDMQGGEAS